MLECKEVPGTGCGGLGRGLTGVFWSHHRKRKVGRPSVQTLYENSSHLTKIGLPQPKGGVYFGSQCHCNVYSAGMRERERETSERVNLGPVL